MMAFARSRFRVDAASLGLLGCCAATVALLACVVVEANRQAACIRADSFLVPLCDRAGAADAGTEGLRARLARNPGDTNAYRELALADGSGAHDRLVATAQRLAPNQPQLLLHQAAAAFDRGDAAAAAAPLTRIVDHYDAPLAARALAQMIVKGEAGLLEPHLERHSRWLPRVLAQMETAQGPLGAALPLVIQGVRLGALDRDTVRRYVRELKAAQAWGDAYALWLAMQGGKPQPLLFNGGFDAPFQPDGFDWEVPDATPRHRAGVVVERREGGEGGERSKFLDLQFTGRPIAMPIVRQRMFLAPGTYRLRGRQLGRQFRSEDGLVWTVACAQGRVGTSGSLADTGGAWRGFDFEFSIPRSCGLVAVLQLETPTPAAAVLGARGRVAFESLSVERIQQ
jgi:hypothetical protein